METIYMVNPNLDIPIYQQLVDCIHNAIKKEVLLSGQQLPTVQEMTESLNIARAPTTKIERQLFALMTSLSMQD